MLLTKIEEKVIKEKCITNGISPIKRIKEINGYLIASKKKIRKQTKDLKKDNKKKNKDFLKGLELG